MKQVAKLRDYKEWRTKEEVEELLRSALSVDSTHVEEGPILSNDIKDGDVFVQTNGWVGEMVDNGRGNTRLANVHGFYTEAGSIYVWDISQVCKDGVLRKIQLTPKQEKDKEKVQDMMGSMF